MKMSCLSPSVPNIDPELLTEIAQALEADGIRLLILAQPPDQRARLFSYGLQPSTTEPIEQNLLWQDVFNPQSTNVQSSNSHLVVQIVDRITDEQILAPLFIPFAAVGIQSLLILPIGENQQYIGCLTVFKSTPIWTTDRLQLAQDLALDLSIAIMQQQIEQLSGNRLYYDLLTGLPNRLLFTRLLTLSLVKIPLTDRVLTVMFLNLDRFKYINDCLGYKIGDRLLQLVATRLKNTLDDRVMIGRWGGDEFALLIPELANTAAVTEVADRILNCFNLPFRFDQSFQTLKTDSLYIKARMGIAIATTKMDSEILLQQADIALDRTRSNSTNKYEIYTAISAHPQIDSPQEQLCQRLRLENILIRAIAVSETESTDDRRLLLHYQPQIDIHTGKIIGIEALIRCQDFHSKIISPADFIPIAEENGSIVPMGKWVIKTACQQNKRWQDLGLGKFPIAVNFSIKQLQDRDLVDTIIAILAETKLSPVDLEVEITESIAIKDLDTTIAILESLRKIGVKIALDDFGTGYSSLAALKYLPLDRLKIDRSFIRELTVNSVESSIVKTIVNLGHDLNLDVMAEGVETAEQLDVLRSINCDTVQGFLFSRPLTAIDLETAMTSGSYWQQHLFSLANLRSH
jgi:diguanylate cyclase (GGDEF)-like protein